MVASTGKCSETMGFRAIRRTLQRMVSVGDATIAMDTENPLTDAITKTLRVDVPQGATGPVGFTNAGYGGIPVDGSNFQSYFWIKGDFSGDATIRLVGNSSGTEYGSKSFAVSSNANNFTYVTISFLTTRAPDGNVYYELTVDAATVAGSSFYIGLPQLFSHTYHHRFVVSMNTLLMLTSAGTTD